MEHLGSDGVLRSLCLKARSKTEALEKFRVFVQVLELCLAKAPDEKILQFVEENPL
jgi:hypothetical protein